MAISALKMDEMIQDSGDKEIMMNRGSQASQDADYCQISYLFWP